MFFDYIDGRYVYITHIVERIYLVPSGIKITNKINKKYKQKQVPTTYLL